MAILNDYLSRSHPRENNMRRHDNNTDQEIYLTNYSDNLTFTPPQRHDKEILSCCR
ncbi:hypothetical protein [Methylobacillus rhizosphaerae]|nr:hypothetical protein [Methylobacillus rhizosphaerae]